MKKEYKRKIQSIPSPNKKEWRSFPNILDQELMYLAEIIVEAYLQKKKYELKHK